MITLYRFTKGFDFKMEKLKNYLKLIRIKHYLKNFLVFAPLLFSGNFFEVTLLLKTLFSFIAFSFTASVVYIINDIRDVEKDKLHPIKKERPIASGKVSKKEGIILAILLFIISIFINWNISTSPISFIILLSYLLMNIAYSFGLKNIPIIDILILSIGFLLRVFYGAVILNLNVSNWLYLTILSISFYLGLGKRRNEIDKSKNSRKVLEHYNRNFLDKNMYMCLALTIIFYSLWCVDPINSLRFGDLNYLLFTVPIVMIICMKYSLNIEGDSFGDPVDVVFSDKTMLALIIIYGLCILLLLYIFPILIKY